jgi:hypothetical protein
MVPLVFYTDAESRALKTGRLLIPFAVDGVVLFG